MLNRIEEARKYLQEAYYINRARCKTEFCDVTKKFAEEHNVEL